MATLAELQTQLATVESRLQSGAMEFSTDGTRTKIDVKSLRIERNRLQQQIDALSSSTERRPVASRIELGGF